MDRYRPTAEVPVITDRREALLRAFYHGSRLDLMNVLYRLAERYLQDTSPDGNDSHKRSLKSSMKLVLFDRSSGAYGMLKLLLSIPDTLLEALIWNTVGTKYGTMEGVEHYDLDNRAGIYVNTIVNGTHRDKGISCQEWSEVRSMIERYIKGHKLVVTDTAPEADRLNAAEAVKVDDTYGIKDDINQYRGDRYWMNANGRTHRFLKELAKRIKPDLDPIGTTRQLQSPCEVGLSNNLDLRVSDHINIRNTIKTWGLVLSCLKVLEIDHAIVSIAALKVWEPDLILKGEILITMLTGSLIEDGGFNVKQPGIGRPVDRYEYRRESREVFVQNPWLMDNLAKAKRELTSKRELFDKVTRFEPQAFRDNIATVRRGLAELTHKREALDNAISNKVNELQHNGFIQSKSTTEVSKQKMEELRQIKIVTNSIQRSLTFKASLDSYRN